MRPRGQAGTSLKIEDLRFNKTTGDDQQPEFRSLSEFYIIIFLNKLKIVVNTHKKMKKIKIRRLWLTLSGPRTDVPAKPPLIVMSVIDPASCVCIGICLIDFIFKYPGKMLVIDFMLISMSSVCNQTHALGCIFADYGVSCYWFKVDRTPTYWRK